jgi:hypothetical protein
MDSVNTYFKKPLTYFKDSLNFGNKYQYLILSQRSTFFGPGISRVWNSLILAAMRAEISGSLRSLADNV